MEKDDMYFALTIYKDGKATIPGWVRKSLNLTVGDVLQVKVISVTINK